ncbi:hypothetical protein TNCV_310171 [Trichonephila clavipes]|nr:hypothetical protein TNCV_310171 [Trichonephila clavipes]
MQTPPMTLKVRSTYWDGDSFQLPSASTLCKIQLGGVQKPDFAGGVKFFRYATAVNPPLFGTLYRVLTCYLGLREHNICVYFSTMTADLFVNLAIQAIALPFMNRIEEKVFQQDNARLTTTVAT